MKNISNNLLPIYEREKHFPNPSPVPKPLEELTMMDSFLFEAATEDVENAKIIAKSIIERISGYFFNMDTPLRSL